MEHKKRLTEYGKFHKGEGRGGLARSTKIFQRKNSPLLWKMGGVSPSQSPNHVISLILIFGCLCRSSLYFKIQVTEKYSTAMCQVSPNPKDNPYFQYWEERSFSTFRQFLTFDRSHYQHKIIQQRAGLLLTDRTPQ